LGVGAYRDDNEKPYVFEVVRQAQKEIIDENQDKVYFISSQKNLTSETGISSN